MRYDERISVTEAHFDESLKRFKDRYKDKLKKKGNSTYVSIWEVLGKFEEERHELVSAVHKKDRKNTEEELLDIAMVCLYGLASLISHEEDAKKWPNLYLENFLISRGSCCESGCINCPYGFNGEKMEQNNFEEINGLTYCKPLKSELEFQIVSYFKQIPNLKEKVGNINLLDMTGQEKKELIDKIFKETGIKPTKKHY